MRRSAIALGVVTLATSTLLGPAALAYVDVGHDPDDRAITGSPPIGGDPDIRSSIRRVEQRRGGRMLVMVIRAYEDFTMYWTIDARLDSRGGRRADKVLHLYNADTGGAGCYVGRGAQIRSLYFRQVGPTARCRIAIRLLKPTKEIRWRLVSETLYEGGEREVAPNGRGWYG